MEEMTHIVSTVLSLTSDLDFLQNYSSEHIFQIEVVQVNMNADNHSQGFPPWDDNADTDGYTILTFKSSKIKQSIRCSHDLEGGDSTIDRDDDSICIQELTDDMEDFIWLQEFSESSIRGENLLNECTLSAYEINGCMNEKRFHDSFIDTKEMIFTDETRRFLKEKDEINEDEKRDESLDYFNDSIMVTKQRKKKKINRDLNFAFRC